MYKYIILNLKLLFKDLRKNIVKALLASFGILFLISFLVIYISLRQSVKNYIGNKLFGSLAINEIIIHPKKKYLKTWQVKKIRKLHGLSKTYGLIKLNYYSRIKIEMAGKEKTPHIPVAGISPDFFRGKIRNWKQFKNKKTIPIIAPTYAFDLFNHYANIKGWGDFSKKTLIGFPAKLHIRTNRMGDEVIESKLNVKLFAFSSAIKFPGLIVPLGFMNSFCSKHSRDTKLYNKGYHYIRMYARVKDVKKLPQTTAKLKRLGLRVESRSDITKKTNRAMSIIDGFTLLIGAVMLILTIISIFNTYLVIVYNRSYSFSLQRVIGISKIRIVFGFIFESVLIGLIYGTAGFYIGTTAITYLSNNLSKWIPALKGLIIEPAGTDLLINAVVISIIISSISALIPAIFASNKNLFKAVNK